MALNTRARSMAACPTWPVRSPARAGTARLSSACARGTDARRRRAMTANKAAIRWCAVYTRKSSEEGLEQQFNSLHAQREAAEAYIKSERIFPEDLEMAERHVHVNEGDVLLVRTKNLHRLSGPGPAD